MPLKLRHRINEGMRIVENSENNKKTTIDVIVRGIIHDPIGINVNFELINKSNLSKLFTLSEGERYDVLPKCTLLLPEDPLRIKPLNSIESDFLNDEFEIYAGRVFLVYFAPRDVEFSKRKIYSILEDSELAESIY